MTEASSEDGTARLFPAQSEPQGKGAGRPPPTAKARAIALLARREHSAAELVRKLIGRGFGAAESAAVVQDLASRDYQSDARYAAMLARTRIADGWGPQRIDADLRVAGVASTLAHAARAAALEYHATDWVGVAGEALRRRGVRLGSLAARRKAFALLQRRGFDGDTIRAALRQYEVARSDD